MFVRLTDKDGRAVFVQSSWVQRIAFPLPGDDDKTGSVLQLSGTFQRVQELPAHVAELLEGK